MEKANTNAQTENSKKYYFEVRYCHIDNIILQEDE